jgi:hypothetical protein
MGTGGRARKEGIADVEYGGRERSFIGMELPTSEHQGTDLARECNLIVLGGEKMCDCCTSAMRNMHRSTELRLVVQT